MSRLRSLLPACALFVSAVALHAQTNIASDLKPDTKQPIDQSYTGKIRQYTTEPYFNSPLTDYLPASKTVPTPAKVLGDVSGAPNMLPYAEDVYRYFRLLESSTPRVKVFTIGHTEEGREMIAAAIADESLLKQLPENDARLAKLADPRTINMDDAKAAELVKQSFPVYYITGTIHSPETGAPTALMELAYRLAVDNSPYIQYIRTHMVVLITPVVEVDGRDRMVDIYKWHLAHPGQQWPHLAYWGHYVSHDNNRDAMAMTLDLTNNVLATDLKFHAQVLHDLHESVPFLYDNTVGDGPYNAWIDPLLNGEWQMLGWNNIQSMTAFGMPGVFTHGDFDTWSPGYLMFLAAMHNGISRLYETFGNGGADTEKRILTPEEYARTWYRPNPPLPVVTWSQRDNNNYEQTALLSTISFFAQNAQQFLENYYTKSKRSIEKPQNAGPAAYVLDQPMSSRQAELLRALARQHVEISRLTASATVPAPALPKSAKDDDKKDPIINKPADKAETFAVGSYVIRMDQPYSRIADALLDRQYWAPNDPQKTPYDDTGWSFGDLFHVKVVRITDPAILKAQLEPVSDIESSLGKLTGTGSVYAVNNAAEAALLGLRYTLKDASISVADAAFDAEGHHFATGSLLIENADADKLKAALKDAGLEATALGAMPSVASHKAPAPRIAFMHTWLSTQTEGWWREAFDHERVPYDYISTQAVARDGDLRSKYDVIIFAPIGRATTREIIDGMPMYGNPLPWEKTELTPNLGRIDSTPDMRPGLTWAGVEHLKGFVSKGGLFITSEDTAQFAIELGLAPGVSVSPHGSVRVVGSILSTAWVDKSSPVANGYDAIANADLGVYSAEGMAFNVSDTVYGGGHRRLGSEVVERPTGRGGPTDEDIPEDRPFVAPEPVPHPKPWEPMPLNEDQARNNVNLIPEQYRPDVILRFGSGKQFLLSGLLEGGSAIEEKPIVVDAHYGEGNTLLFANNPVYRGETIGSYALVFNAIMNYDRLTKPQAAPAK